MCSFRFYSGTVETHLTPTSEIGVQILTQFKWNKLVVPVGQLFKVQNLDQLYVLNFSALPTT